MRTVYDNRKKLYGLRYTVNHKGKMQGIHSLSTSCLSNDFCLTNMKCRKSVCAHCFSKRYQSYRSKLREGLERNYEILSKELIPDEYIPVITNTLFRFESFGELSNDTHFINFCNIARKNPDTKFALWTKRYAIVKRNKESIPDNLSIVVSVFTVNDTMSANSLAKTCEGFADHVFCVYDKEYAKSHGINIECGKNACILCKRCYSKTEMPDIVTELLK